jgi:oxygen-independent coproporphyrinogen III oxidase
MPSLYVHVPFCVKKCDYCAFYSVPLQSSRVKMYLESLGKEIQLRQNEASEGISSLFIGGGTPTALDEEGLEAFLRLVKQGFDFKGQTDRSEFSRDIEQTIEGNPGTLTSQKLTLLRKYGINRISLGAQALNDQLLRRIGRIHTTQEIQEGVHLVRKAGFKNLNLDLMFGLPGQSLSDWQKTLEEVLKLQPEHLSVYGLMVEENTPLALNQERINNLPSDDAQAEMYDLAREILGREGYGHYETSNFALPGYECQHNLGYWYGNEYLGLGPGAVSFRINKRANMLSSSINEYRRWKNIEDLNQYEQKLANGVHPIDPEEDEFLTNQDRIAERIILGLRLAKGLNLEAFKKEFGQNFQDIFPTVLERYLKAGVFRLEGKFLRMESNYWFVANSVLEEFV